MQSLKRCQYRSSKPQLKIGLTCQLTKMNRKNNMLNKTLLVVSDKFKNFASNKNVITKSELFTLLNTNNIAFPKNTLTKLVPGQGFSEKDIEAILDIKNTSKNTRFFDFEMWKNYPKKASSLVTHKVNSENILISQPQIIKKDLFNMNLVIDEACEMMRDHQTGLHLQGILLTEASRQAYIAIIESFFPPENFEKRYFIFNKMSVTYNNFAFPIPAKIIAKITHKDFTNSKKKIATMKIEIEQCEKVSASFYLEMTMMENKRISLMEEKLAKKYLYDHTIAILQENTTEEMANV